MTRVCGHSSISSKSASTALGVQVWPMVELEADDALASAAAVCAADGEVEQVAIWTPDKDLGQCVVEQRVVQFDRRKRLVIDAAGVHEKFGVWPASIPDWLGLVGDSADGFPGIAGWGKQSAATVLDHYGRAGGHPTRRRRLGPGGRPAGCERQPRGGVGSQDMELALLFRELARLVVEPPCWTLPPTSPGGPDGRTSRRSVPT